MSRYTDVEKMPSGPNWDALNDKEKATVLSLLIKLPTANVEEVRHGMWVHTGDYDNHYRPIYICSVCNEEVADSNIHVNKYCLYCGAKMDRE